MLLYAPTVGWSKNGRVGIFFGISKHNTTQKLPFDILIECAKHGLTMLASKA